MGQSSRMEAQTLVSFCLESEDKTVETLQDVSDEIPILQPRGTEQRETKRGMRPTLAAALEPLE